MDQEGKKTRVRSAEAMARRKMKRRLKPNPKRLARDRERVERWKREGRFGRPRPSGSAELQRARFQRGDEGPPTKKRKTGKKLQLEIVAPHATLDGLPDNIVLFIMTFLDLRSLVMLSRACRRFHHLYSDESIWEEVDLSRESTGVRLDARKLKQIVRTHLSESVLSVKLSSNAFSSSKPPIVTEPVLDLLFERCPNIQRISLHKCDLTTLSHKCSLYSATQLTHLSFVECKSSHHWFKELQPSWSSLTHLSFEGSTMVGDHELRYIAVGPCGKTIRRLNIRGCYRISQSFLLEVCTEMLVSLRELDIRDCSSEITASEEFLNHNKLKHITILV